MQQKDIDKLLKVLERKTDRKIKSKVSAETPQESKPFKRPRTLRRYTSSRSYIVRFLQEKTIQAGKYYFKSKVFYKYFLNWLKYKKRNPILFTSFQQVMKLYLPYKINKKRDVYFGINVNLRETSFLTPKREGAIERWANGKAKKKGK